MIPDEGTDHLYSPPIRSLYGVSAFDSQKSRVCRSAASTYQFEIHECPVPVPDLTASTSGTSGIEGNSGDGPSQDTVCCVCPSSPRYASKKSGHTSIFRHIISTHLDILHPFVLVESKTTIFPYEGEDIPETNYSESIVG